MPVNAQCVEPLSGAVLQLLATAAGVARAISQTSLVGFGPNFNNVNPFNDPSILYRVEDRNGNGDQAWQIRDANYPTGAPDNQVAGSTPTNLNALWVPILAVSTVPGAQTLH